eukprot:jgi/Ulvmu1/1159/UM107_0033.1
MSEMFSSERAAPAFSAPVSTRAIDMKALKAAVSSAVLQMGDDKTTVLHEDGVASQPTNNGPLALMLDYGDDDDDDDDDEDENDVNSGTRGGGAQEHSDPSSSISAVSVIAASSERRDPSMPQDDPLASFLDDLSSQGLLDEEKDTPSAGSEPEQPVALESPSQNIIQWLSDSWALVEDTGSAAVYYWNQQTNDVSWELPDGVSPAAAATEPSPQSSPAQTAHTDANASIPAASTADDREGRIEADTDGAFRAVDLATDAAAAHAPAAPPADEAAQDQAQPLAADAAAAAAAELDRGLNASASTADHGQTATGAPQPHSTDAELLPSGWVRLVDEESGLPYYWHADSNTTQWESPPAADRGPAAIDGAAAAQCMAAGAADGGSLTEAAAAVLGPGQTGCNAAADSAGGAGDGSIAAARGESGPVPAADAAEVVGVRAGAWRAVAAQATLAHARASAALSDALLATAPEGGAGGGGVEEVSLLRAELLVRQGDLAALRGVLRGAAAADSGPAAGTGGSAAGTGGSAESNGEAGGAAAAIATAASPLSMDAVVAVCQHVEGHVRGVLTRAAAARGGAGPAAAVRGISAANAAVGGWSGVGAVAGDAAEVEDGELVGARAGGGVAAGGDAAGLVHGEGAGTEHYMHETYAMSPWVQELHALGARDAEEPPPPLPEEPPPEDPPPGLEEEHGRLEGGAGAAGGGVAAEADVAADAAVDAGCAPPLPTGDAEAETAVAAEQDGSGERDGVAEAAPAAAPVAVKRRRGADASAAGSGAVAAGAGAKKQKKLKGRTGKLLDRWHNVARELEAEESARQRPVDLAARDRVRAADVEEWIAEQFRSGAAQSNPNFVPLPHDWRERVRERAAAREAAAAAAGAAAAAAADKANALFFDTEPDLGVLSVGLPEGWRALWDPSSKGVYYGHVDTKVSSWTRPT